MVVGGAGVQLQPILPRPLDASRIGESRQGTIVNVFTEPQWRRRGIAGRLVNTWKATKLQHCHWVIDFRFALRQLFKFAQSHFLALITVD